MAQFWITLLSLAAGAVGYLAVTFWVRPILRYREIRYEVDADLVFYANAVELEKKDGSIRQDTLDRKESNRRHAASLIAIYRQLPHWYLWRLEKTGENPQEAFRSLIALSNSSTWAEVTEHAEEVEKHLGLSEDWTK